MVFECACMCMSVFYYILWAFSIVSHTRNDSLLLLHTSWSIFSVLMSKAYKYDCEKEQNRSEFINYASVDVCTSHVARADVRLKTLQFVALLTHGSIETFARFFFDYVFFTALI